VKKIEQEVGDGWFTSKMPIETRRTNAAGLFAIPFSWDSAEPNNLARVAGVQTLQIKVAAVGFGWIRPFWGQGFKVPDVVQLIENIKSGNLARSGDLQRVYDKLKPQFKDVLTGKEFSGIPFSMLSTDQTAILALLPDLRM
jgi:hypothetical protein